MPKAVADDGGRRRDGNDDRSDEAEGESACRPLFQGHSCHQLIMRPRGAICQLGSAVRGAVPKERDESVLARFVHAGGMLWAKRKTLSASHFFLVVRRRARLVP
jgi:hypothetical protein